MYRVFCHYIKCIFYFILFYFILFYFLRKRTALARGRDFIEMRNEPREKPVALIFCLVFLQQMGSPTLEGLSRPIIKCQAGVVKRKDRDEILQRYSRSGHLHIELHWRFPLKAIIAKNSNGQPKTYFFSCIGLLFGTVCR